MQLLDAKIEKGTIDTDALIEIQIPLQMPYIGDMEYEPAYGQTIINGVHYHFVKRKITGNTLFLLCLPNEVKTILENKKLEFANADYNTKAKSGKSGKPIKVFSFDFYELGSIFSGSNRNWDIIQNKYPNCKSSLFYAFLTTPKQPPETIA